MNSSPFRWHLLCEKEQMFQSIKPGDHLRWGWEWWAGGGKKKIFQRYMTKLLEDLGQGVSWSFARGENGTETSRASYEARLHRRIDDVFGTRYRIYQSTFWQGLNTFGSKLKKKKKSWSTFLLQKTNMRYLIDFSFCGFSRKVKRNKRGERLVKWTFLVHWKTSLYVKQRR